MIKQLDDPQLQYLCQTAAVSAMDLLKHFEYNSYQWLLHTSGLAFGIWLSVCDEDHITQEEVESILDDLVKSQMN